MNALVLLLGAFVLMGGGSSSSSSTTAPPQSTPPTTPPGTNTGQIIVDTVATVTSLVEAFKKLMDKK